MTRGEIMDGLDEALVNYLQNAIEEKRLLENEAIPAALYLIVKTLEGLE